MELFANALHTTTAYLMGVDGPALPPGCEPLPRLKRLPLVGRIGLRHADFGRAEH